MSRWRLFCICIYLSSAIFLFPSSGQAQIHISAHNGVLMELSTGRVLYDKRAHERQSIASLTKVMTAIIAIESNQLSDVLKTSRRAVYTSGSSIYLEQGETMTLEDLTYGLMLRSGNDAAVAIAEHIGGSVEGFVHLMNEKAQWIGMTNTNFANPHGLEEDEHYSTAYDLALLTRYAMNNDTFREISATKKHKANNRTYEWFNKNKLLTQLYEYCTGGKTGFTKTAGRTLMTTAYHNNMELVVVTLNAGNDWQDHMHLFDYGFETFEMTLVDHDFFLPEGLQNLQTNETYTKQTGSLYPLNRLERNYLQNVQAMNLLDSHEADNSHLINSQLSISELFVNVLQKTLRLPQVFK